MSEKFDEALSLLKFSLKENFSGGRSESFYIEIMKICGGEGLKLIPKRYQSEAICSAAVETDGLALEHVEEKFKTPDLLSKAVIENGNALSCIDKRLQTLDICEKAVNKDNYAKRYIRDEKIKEQITKICKMKPTL
jgi:hypothetical protein